MKRTGMFLELFAVILLLQSSCAPALLDRETNQGSIVVAELIKTTQSWDGESLPRYPQGQPEITIRRIIIAPGAQLENHSHPVINAGVLITGQLTVVTTDGKTLRLKPGDPIVEVVNTVHHGINEGTVPAEIVVFYAGAINMPTQVLVPSKI